MLKSKLQQFLLQLYVLATCLKTALACHGTLLAAGITEEEKHIILKEHNRLRQTVATGHYPGQPGAENMRELIWDEELAFRAQKWAENCQFKHDPFRTINRFTMGQNMAIIWSTAPLDPDDGDFPSRIQSWFNEVQLYSFGDAWSPKTGHYSQLVWGETNLVGCGFAEYKDARKYNKLYVCNYGPGGNVVGYKPYEVGRPSCSSYGLKPSLQYQGLCAGPEVSLGYSINAIETYEYNNNNNKQATTINVQHTHKTSLSSSVSKSTKYLSDYSDYTFGTNTVSDSHTYSTEAVQHYNYQNQLEVYNSSPDEFKESVYEHTLLHTSVDQQLEQEHGLQTQQLQQEEQRQQYLQQTVRKATPQPIRRWSLLTWRG